MRNKTIDILRGLGILSIIFIHVTAWFRGDKVAYSIWNWGQFAVPVFVFCSTYLFFIKKEKYEQEGFINYSLNRLKRLLAPYYLFLIFLFLIYLLKDAEKIQWQSVLMNITLTTPGNELNWAVLLFVYLTILMFPLVGLWRKARTLFILYSLFALTSSVLLLIYKWPFNYKLVMWLPWSLIILFSWYFARYETRKLFYPLTLVGTGLLFVGLYFLKDTFGNAFEFIKNKYPPNLYYLSYGMFSVTVIYYLAKGRLFDAFHKQIHFLSANSYTIFFIHLWLVIAFSEFMNIQRFVWWQFFAIILVLTLAVQLLINKIRS